MDQPTAEQALRQLEPPFGEWTLEARWPDGQPWPGGGKVTFEGRWEIAEDGTNYSTDFDLIYSRRVDT